LFCKNPYGINSYSQIKNNQVSRETAALKQGCQILLGPKYQNGEKCTKLPQNIPNGHKIFPMAVK
jgi:hypothetical protein